MSWKHTAGPWKAFGREVLDVGGAKLCDFSGWTELYASQAEANVKLIAAAPEMAELIELWLPVIESLDSGREDEDDPLPSIAKAREILARIKS